MGNNDYDFVIGVCAKGSSSVGLVPSLTGGKGNGAATTPNQLCRHIFTIALDIAVTTP